MRVLALAAALALVPALSGCVGPGPALDGQAPEVLVLPEMCGRLGDRCREEMGVWTVEGLHLVAEGAARTGLGLRVALVDGDLRLRNVTLEGFTVGIGISPTPCRTCRLHLEGVRLVGPAVPDGQVSTGILDLDDVPPPAAAPDVVAAGVSASRFRVGLQLAPTAGEAWPPRARLELSDVEVACQDLGVDVRAMAAALRDVRVEGCTHEGLNLESSAGLVEGGHARGSGTGAMLMGGWRVAGLGLHGNRVGLWAWTAFEASGLDVAGNQVGVFAIQGGRLEGSTLAGNSVAAAAPLPFPGTMLLDARGNYWGSPAGPQPAVAGQPPVPALGDRYSGAVVAAPFLPLPP